MTSPFVVGLGYQRSPNLRSIDFSNNTSTVVPTNRYLVFFVIDVTLFMHAF
jgi:hypothetical protein